MVVVMVGVGGMTMLMFMVSMADLGDLWGLSGVGEGDVDGHSVFIVSGFSPKVEELVGSGDDLVGDGDDLVGGVLVTEFGVEGAN
jgi:hypothetical protein